MKIRELNERIKSGSLYGATIDNYKWDDIKNNLSSKKSTCCNKPIILLGSSKQDIGVCSKCRKFAFDRKRVYRLRNNRNQSFKRIASDALYNFKGVSHNFSVKDRAARNEGKKIIRFNDGA
ncbi:hypothetical protein H8D85_02225 [bacterium]|nr:hypothetical protein [bacterium]